nr:MAG TPA: hypothetical protein [Caudoviricetes sp.]
MFLNVIVKIASQVLANRKLCRLVTVVYEFLNIQRFYRHIPHREERELIQGVRCL